MDTFYSAIYHCGNCKRERGEADDQIVFLYDLCPEHQYAYDRMAEATED